MKVNIAGSRAESVDLRLINKCVRESQFVVTEVVSGKCEGIDFNGELWADAHDIPIKEFPAKWSELGGKAGPMRNAQMAEYADALLLIWDGKSRGSASMLAEAKKHGLRIYQHIIGGSNDTGE